MSLSNAGLSATYAYAGEIPNQHGGSKASKWIKGAVNTVANKHLISKGLNALGDTVGVFVPGASQKINELGGVARKYGAGKKKRH